MWIQTRSYSVLVRPNDEDDANKDIDHAFLQVRAHHLDSLIQWVGNPEAFALFEYKKYKHPASTPVHQILVPRVAVTLIMRRNLNYLWPQVSADDLEDLDWLVQDGWREKAERLGIEWDDAYSMMFHPRILD
jgi:hypothetical protein